MPSEYIAGIPVNALEMFGVTGSGPFISEVLCKGNETHPFECTTDTKDEVCENYAGVICLGKYLTYLKFSGLS